MKNKDTVIIANPDVIIREDLNEWVTLFVPNTGEIYTLNPIGYIIWELLDGKHNIHDIIDELKQNCNNMPDDADTYVLTFIDGLLKNGLAYQEQTNKGKY